MLDKTLIIVNPAARSGKANEAAAHAAGTFNRMKAAYPKELESITFRYTVSPQDATRIARAEGAQVDSIFVIGGDGVIHETVNGLMALPRADRPRLGIIPCGNGDDFARTIGMDRAPQKSLQQIESFSLTPKCIDIGCVNGTWFAETLSFGLDAAIALGTADLRKKTKRTGTSLYLQCGFDQVMNHRTPRSCTVRFDDREPQVLSVYLLAVQNGTSYGGGFKICPDARLNDGLLDICYAEPELSASAALKLLLKAKNGNHTAHPNLTFAHAKHVVLDFEDDVPAQVDGERIESRHFDIELFPGELDVLIP